MVWMLSRRTLLRAALTSAGAGLALDSRLVARVLVQAACADASPAGTLLGTLPLFGDRPLDMPYGEMLGGPGLDARLFTDLGSVDSSPVTPTGSVFVRTAAPPTTAARLRQPWSISTGGLAGSRAPLHTNVLRDEARPMGPHLIECAGNADPNNFGLLSVAEWDGVPFADIVGRLKPLPEATGVLVSGLDGEASRSGRSIPGASWILGLDQLQQQGAFLATGMNGEPLAPDHGAPVRLAVPGWYGCAWIKWVQEIKLVGAQEPVTTQMAECAGRTHQDGLPALARDYEAPVIDLAATPVRVERRQVGSGLDYRIVGIAWGGSRPPSDLQIRFGSRDPWTTVDRICPAPEAPRTWSVWTHRWRPESTGTYTISLRCADPAVRTRRLDLFYYSRRVRIDEV